jgi:CheY-like chemotaxis protein
MAKLVLVDSRPNACPAWQAALKAKGHEVWVAACGSFVLTMLERNRPDVIVSHAALEDMSGCELCGIVLADPMTSDIPFILLTDGRTAGPDTALHILPDSMLPDNVSPACLVRRVEEVLLEAALSGGSSREATVRGGTDECDTAAAPDPIRGSLDVLDLFDVIQTISDARQRGWLVVCLLGSKGAIAFDSGQPVHAAFNGQIGNQAFVNLALASVGVRDATFQFIPSHDPGGPALPKTIEGNVKKLMFSLAARMDKARRNTETSPNDDVRDALTCQRGAR